MKQEKPIEKKETCLSDSEMEGATGGSFRPGFLQADDSDIYTPMLRPDSRKPKKQVYCYHCGKTVMATVHREGGSQESYECPLCHNLISDNNAMMEE